MVGVQKSIILGFFIYFCEVNWRFIMIKAPDYEIYTEKDTIFHELGKSQFEFYLTGSRLFGGWRYNSDWDFFTGECPDVREFLKGLGFARQITEKHYNDTLTIDVYTLEQKQDKDIVKIDVQIVNNVHLKLKATMILRSYLSGKIPGDKLKKSRIWNMAIRLAQLEPELTTLKIESAPPLRAGVNRKHSVMT